MRKLLGMTFLLFVGIFGWVGCGEDKGPVSPTTCVEPLSGLVSWWPGDGDTGDIVGANDAILENGAAFAPGLVGQAFSFDGQDDMVVVPDSPSLRPSEVTVSAWVKFSSLEGQTYRAPRGKAYIVFKRNSRLPSFDAYSLTQDRVGDGDHRFFFGVNSADGSWAGAVSTIKATVGTWIHVAGTYDGKTARLYVHGFLQDEVFHGFPLDHSSQPLVIGRSGQDGEPGEANHDAAFAGLIDEVGIYNRALNSVEIRAIAQAGSFGKCKP